MRSIILAYSILLISSVVAEEMDERDPLFKPLMEKACLELGESCAKYKLECSKGNTAMPNACLSVKYFNLKVAKEKCGDKYLTCYKENNDFAAKWMHELNIPNMKHPKREEAFEVCWSEAGYAVKSEKLKEFEKLIVDAFGNQTSNFFTDYKLLYNCFERYYDSGEA